MKQYLLSILALLCVSIIAAEDPLRRDFANPPDAVRAESWWHWTSNYVTKAGITADLEAMKAVGMGGAHLFLAPFSNTPDGPPILTPEWMELFRFASQEAKRLGLSLGIHNCPGWSSSGGPWIKPELSMQSLVWITVDVDGPGNRNFKMPKPLVREGFYRDIKILALPVPGSMPEPEISLSVPEGNPALLVDNDVKTAIVLPVKQRESSCSVILKYPAPVSARFLALTFNDRHLFARGEVAVQSDSGDYRKVASFHFERENDLQGPKYIPLDEQTAATWRITFVYPGFPGWWYPQDLRLSEIKLLSSAMIENIEMRNSAANRFAYAPPAPEKNNVGIDPAKILDITDKLGPDGFLEWQAPAGNWTILRLGHTASGKKNAPASLTGLECDKLSKRGLDAHFPAMLGKLLKVGTLDVAIIDSFEAGGQNWTPGFEKEFEARRGYRIDDYYPALAGFVVGNEKESAKFLYDFQRTVADLFAENYFDYFTELCHKHNLKTILETYGGPFENLRCSRSADIPANEFWMGGSPNKLAGSGAHIYGKQQAAAESFTSSERRGHGRQDPAMLKESGDNAWLLGVNKLMLHSFVHQPWLNIKPGLTLGSWGSSLNRNNTWWNQFHPYINYINRAQVLLSAGKPVADLLILSGESNPNQLPTRSELPAAGYDYDYCNTDVILNRLEVENGRLKLPDGTTYAMLHLGNDRYLTHMLLARIRELVGKGAVVAGIAPLDSPSLADGAEWRKLVKELFGDAKEGSMQNIGKGKFIISAKPLDALRRAKITADTVLPAGVAALHRRYNDSEIYFVRNGNSAPVKTEMGFRVPPGSEPYIWDAESGEVSPAPVFRREDHLCYVDMQLNEKGTCFVVFAPQKQQPDIPVSAIAAPPGKLEILEARFYAENSPSTGQDVTNELKKLVTPAGICVKVTSTNFGIDDPAKGQHKLLRVKFRNDTVSDEIVAAENQVLEIRALPVIDSPLVIQRAVYRAKGSEKGRDVTWEVRALQTVQGVDFPVTSDLLGGDAAPRKAKELYIEYSLNGKAASLTIGERGKVQIKTGVVIDSPIVIEKAVYRSMGSKEGRDVTAAVRQLIQPAGLDFRVENDLLGGDPAPMKPKELFLSYKIGSGKSRTLTVREKGQVMIPSGSPAPVSKANIISLPDGRRMARFEQSDVLAVALASGERKLLVAPVLPEALSLDRDWQVTFPLPAASAKTVAFPALTPWNEMEDEDVRYFSGTATYRRSFELPQDGLLPGREWVLDLGSVKNLVTVEINGVEAGILWHAPFRMDAACYLKPGTNELILKVTNLWPNRLIGDMRIPGKDKMRGRVPEWVALDLPKSESGRTAYSGGGGYKADDELLLSGLIGPVRLRPAALIPLK